MKKLWGRNMQLQRKVVGLSQVELATALGVTQSTVSRWESGEAAPTVENQLAIARALKTDARLLFAFPTAA